METEELTRLVDGIYKVSFTLFTLFLIATQMCYTNKKNATCPSRMRANWIEILRRDEIITYPTLLIQSTLWTIKNDRAGIFIAVKLATGVWSNCDKLSSFMSRFGVAKKSSYSKLTKVFIVILSQKRSRNNDYTAISIAL